MNIPASERKGREEPASDGKAERHPSSEDALREGIETVGEIYFSACRKMASVINRLKGKKS